MSTLFGIFVSQVWPNALTEFLLSVCAKTNIHLYIRFFISLPFQDDVFNLRLRDKRAIREIYLSFDVKLRLFLNFNLLHPMTEGKIDEELILPSPSSDQPQVHVVILSYSSLHLILSKNKI